MALDDDLTIELFADSAKEIFARYYLLGGGLFVPFGALKRVDLDEKLKSFRCNVPKVIDFESVLPAFFAKKIKKFSSNVYVFGVRYELMEEYAKNDQVMNKYRVSFGDIFVETKPKMQVDDADESWGLDYGSF